MDGYYALAQPFLTERERMLDIGCDIGLLLESARQDGFRELHGIEPNPKASRVAARIPGVALYEKFYEEQPFCDASFDLITLIHVVDHLVDSKSVLERSLRHLKPGGIILAVVHDVGSPLSQVLGERFPPLNLYHHYFFSRATLRLLFEKCGFEVVRVAPTYNQYSMGFLIDKAPGLPVPARTSLRRALEAVGLARIPLTIPLGNIGIVARRPRQ